MIKKIFTKWKWFADDVPYVIESRHNLEPDSAYSASGRVIYEGAERAEAECERVRKTYGLSVRKRQATEEEKRTAKLWL
jgi:hypothetical protein